MRHEAKKTLADLKEGLSSEEFEILIQKRVDTMEKFANKFLEHGEYVTIEFDTDKETAEVIKR